MEPDIFFDFESREAALLVGDVGLLLVLERFQHLGFDAETAADNRRRHHHGQDDSENDDRLTIKMHGQGVLGTMMAIGSVASKRWMIERSKVNG